MGLELDAVGKALKKKYGDIFSYASDIIDNEKQIISVSPQLDIGLSGGIPEGSWVIISGAPKIGKSTLALTICAEAQKTGKTCYYIDAEGRSQKKILTGIKGLNPNKLVVLKSQQGNIKSAEEWLSLAEELIKSEPDIVVVIDSASAMCSSSELDAEEITAAMRNNGPKLLASFTRKLANVVPVQNTIIIIIQHLIANTSGYGKKYFEDGGNKIQYQADVKIRGRSQQKWEEKGKQIGQKVQWDIDVSALGAPGQTVEGYIRYGLGVDKEWEIIDLAASLGLIDKSGAWFELAFLDEPIKLQGQQKVWDHLQSSPVDMALLQKKIKELL